MQAASVFKLRETYSPTPSELDNMVMNLPLIFEKDEMGNPISSPQPIGSYLMQKMILECVSSFNVGRLMSPMQIENLAFDLMDEFPTDPITMFKMFFTKARRGAFGEDFNRLDGPTFFRWYKTFRNDTIDVIGPNLRREPDLCLPEHDNTKSDMTQEEIDARFEALLKRISVNKSKRE